MDATYGTYVDDKCFDIHAYDVDTDHDTNEDTDDNTDDDTNDDTDDDTDDGGHGDQYTIAYSETLMLDVVQPWLSILEELWTWY